MRVKKIIFVFCIMQLFVQLFPQSVQDSVNKGFEFFNKKDYENALKCFDEAVNLDTSNPSSYYYRAQAYMKLTKLKLALEDLNTAIGINNTNFLYFHNRGYVYLMLKEYDNAFKDFNTSLSFNDNNSKANSCNALIKYFQHDCQNSLSFYDKAIKLESSNAYFYFFKLFVSYQANHAVDDKILKLIDDKKYLFNDWQKVLANLFLDKITPEQVVEKTKDDNEELCEAYFYIAVKYVLKGDNDRAKEYYQKCISIPLPNFLEYQIADFELNKK